MAVIGDSSAIVDYLHGYGSQAIEKAIQAETLVLPPIVIAELLSSTSSKSLLFPFVVGEVLKDLPMHDVGREHGMAVGELRRDLKRHGLNVTIPDAHVTQCAIDLDATLLAGDKIFRLIAEHIPLRLA